MIFAVKSDMNFEPRGNVDLGAVAIGYTTPAPWRRYLGGLSAINGVKAQVDFKIERNAGAASVDLTLRLKTAGGVVLGDKAVTIPTGGTLNDSMPVDVGAVNGGSALFLEVDVTTADAGTTATIDAVLATETPIISFGC